MFFYHSKTLIITMMVRWFHTSNTYSEVIASLTGTISGVPVAVASSSKFGSPSVAMVTDILGITSAKTIIGVGYCGALQADINCGDLIIVTGAVRDEGTTSRYVPLSFPAVANLSLVNRLIKTATDRFYLTDRSPGGVHPSGFNGTTV